MGHYRILEKIGEGGFGLVYKARDEQDGRLVAIKQILLATLSAQEMIEVTDSYNREITLLPKLRHENIPLIYDHFTDPEHWYLVLEYIDGQTLEERLTRSRKGRLPLRKVLEIGIQLCEVLGYLHAQGPPIIFRDIKPANIMITHTGKIFLIDFGIARRYREGQSKDTRPLGSPGYAAPEQYGRTQTTPQTDIYGLGALLQTLLTGKEPLDIQAAGIPTDCEFPLQLQGLISQMMAHDSDQRPASMLTVKQSLQGLLSASDVFSAGRFGNAEWLATIWSFFMGLVGTLLFFGPLPALSSLFILSLFIYFELFKIKSGIQDTKNIKYIPAFFKDIVCTFRSFQSAKDCFNRLTRKDMRVLIKAALTKSSQGAGNYLIGSWLISFVPSFDFLTISVHIIFLLVYVAGIVALSKGWLPFLKRWRQAGGTSQSGRVMQVPLIKQQIRKRP